MPGVHHAEIVVGFGILRVEFDGAREVAFGCHQVVAPEIAYAALGVGHRAFGVATDVDVEVGNALVHQAHAAQGHAAPEIGAILPDGIAVTLHGRIEVVQGVIGIAAQRVERSVMRLGLDHAVVFLQCGERLLARPEFGFSRSGSQQQRMAGIMCSICWHFMVCLPPFPVKTAAAPLYSD